MMRRIISCVALAVSLLALSAQGLWADGKITIAAAANLGSISEQLKAAFVKANPGCEVEFVLGASGALTTQIQNGAPFDVFMSADTAFPAKLIAGGQAAGSAVIYASGKLILLSTKNLPFKAKGLAVLSDPAVKQFAIANPETAPYGKAAVEALKKSGLWDSLSTKVVTAQNIGQAFQYALTASDAGFVNKSVLYTKEGEPYAAREGVNWMEVDPASYAPIDQAWVVLKKADGTTSAGAQAFAKFLSSKEARAIFLAAGYAVPK